MALRAFRRVATLWVVCAGAALALLVSACSSSDPTTGADSDGPSAAEIGLLAVLQAGSATATEGGDGSWTLVLADVDPTLLWFADHPARDSGTADAFTWIEHWADHGFADDPPNAALHVDGGHGMADPVAAIELTEPTGDRTNRVISFNATVLAGSPPGGLPATMSDITLFIDDASATAPTSDASQSSTYGCNGGTPQYVSITSDDAPVTIEAYGAAGGQQWSNAGASGGGAGGYARSVLDADAIGDGLVLSVTAGCAGASAPFVQGADQGCGGGMGGGGSSGVTDSSGNVIVIAGGGGGGATIPTQDPVLEGLANVITCANTAAGGAGGNGGGQPGGAGTSLSTAFGWPFGNVLICMMPEGDGPAAGSPAAGGQGGNGGAGAAPDPRSESDGTPVDRGAGSSTGGGLAAPQGSASGSGGAGSGSGGAGAGFYDDSSHHFALSAGGGGAGWGGGGGGSLFSDPVEGCGAFSGAGGGSYSSAGDTTATSDPVTSGDGKVVITLTTP